MGKHITFGASDRRAFRWRAFSAGATFGRRDLFIWIAAILFANQLFGVTERLPSPSVATVVQYLGAVGIFQYLAWYAVFRLLAESRGDRRADRSDIVAAILLGLLILLPSTRMIWFAAVGLSVYAWSRSGGDLKQRSAAAVLLALAVQGFWGHAFYDFFAYDLLRAETAAVGTLLSATQQGITWQENIITASDGFGIAIYSGCSSFFNLSVAMLCWITLTKLQRPFWQRSDLVAGAIVGATMILLNFARLYMMALNLDLYRYWHDGAGADIFSVTASVAILTLSLYGARRGAHPR